MTGSDTHSTVFEAEVTWLELSAAIYVFLLGLLASQIVNTGLRWVLPNSVGSQFAILCIIFGVLLFLLLFLLRPYFRRRPTDGERTQQAPLLMNNAHKRGYIHTIRQQKQSALQASRAPTLVAGIL